MSIYIYIKGNHEFLYVPPSPHRHTLVVHIDIHKTTSQLRHSEERKQPAHYVTHSIFFFFRGIFFFYSFFILTVLYTGSIHKAPDRAYARTNIFRRSLPIVIKRPSLYNRPTPCFDSTLLLWSHSASPFNKGDPALL